MKEAKRQQVKQLFIEAAKKIVLSDGHEAITVRRVADLTGYSYPILYHYFKDLSALQWELRLNMIEEMIAALSQNSPANPSNADDILLIFKAYTDYFFMHPNIFRFFYFHIFIKPEGNDDYLHLEQRFVTMWQDAFTNLVQMNLLKPEDIQLVAKTLIFSVQGMIMLSLSSNGSMTQNEIHSELELLVKYLFSKKL